MEVRNRVKGGASASESSEGWAKKKSSCLLIPAFFASEVSDRVTSVKSNENGVQLKVSFGGGFVQVFCL
jgi:hypothetical protein